MAEHAGSESSSPDTDRDFDPTAEQLINDFDDERTLEEEENLSDNSCSNELDDLTKEGDMPMEALLAMYGVQNSANGGAEGSGGGPSQSTDREGDGGDAERSGMSAGSADEDQDTSRSSSESEILENQDLTLDKEIIARDLLSSNSPADDRETTINDLLHTVASTGTARLLRSNSQPGSEASSDSEEDVDYSPEEDKESKKMIQVGHDYQASIPEGFSHYGDAPAYENEDRLLWNPSKIDWEKLENYLREVKVQSLANAAGVASIPTGSHVEDDEQALYLLLQCGHNTEEALRRRKMQVILPSDPMSLWSEDECVNFETGLRLYGKNFYQIQQYKVRTRSVGELVQFYYMWKKSARHDAFANKNRLEKRKYTLHPGVTDYMDRFLNEQESGALPGSLPGRDRSASPINSMMYSDHHKRSITHLRQDLDEVSSTTLGPVDLQPIGGSAASVLHTPGGAGDGLLGVGSDQCVVGSSAATTCAGGTKRSFEPDTALDSSGGVGMRGSDLNGNTEDSEAASEPVAKKLKVDVGEGGGGGGAEQPADSSSSYLPNSSSTTSSSSTGTKLLDTLPVTGVTNIDSISSTILKPSELSSSSSEKWGQSAAESVGI